MVEHPTIPTAGSCFSLGIIIHKKEAVLVAPAEPTPRESKPLSDIDDQETIRFPVACVQFYRHQPELMKRREKDPSKVVREAVGKALVWYYPLAGRLREEGSGKLIVECTGEGVLFVEADAEVSLEDLGVLQPPFPDDLLVESSDDRGPLILIQVTRLSCGGFVVGFRWLHCLCDAEGMVQFMNAVGEISRGAPHPSISPVWQRDLLCARNPPRVTCLHTEYDRPPGYVLETSHPTDVGISHRCFFFGKDELAALRKRLTSTTILQRPRPSSCNNISTTTTTTTTFEVLTACIWKSWTAAMNLDLDQESRILLTVNARNRYSDPPLPTGYYGNVIAFSAAVATAGALRGSTLDYAVELIQAAKANVTEEHMRSLADFLVLQGKPDLCMQRSYVVSDVTHSGFDRVDFGWGPPAYGGMAAAVLGEASFYVRCKNAGGEEGIAVPICLPTPMMERFAVEIRNMINEPPASD